jgi:hypothetical protein
MSLFSDDDGDESSKQERGGFEDADYFSGNQFRKRVVDKEAGVVLYGVGNNKSFGLTALPIEDTDLEIDD